ncbi:MAG: SusD/RagB family nutrient-binding outer membrane lipoprotein [Gemmatimonadales bacterium]
MRTLRKVALCITLPLGLGACKDFLTGPKLDNNPNQSSQATAGQLLSSVTANANILLNGPGTRLTAMWVQQMAGTDRQYQTFGLYQGLTESNYDVPWGSVYTGGGLVDVRNIESLVAGDRTYLGIAKVWEAIFVGNAADMWGDVPYKDVISGASVPTLDHQADVYAALQTKLSDAISDLGAGSGTGPGLVDLIYSGDRAKWIAAAHTLKAHLYLHTAKANAAAYASALTEAQQGITNASGNFLAWASAKAGEENLWNQFFRERDSYMRGGKFFVDLLKARNDPRLSQYFGLNGAGGYGGAAPGEGLDGAVHSWLSAARGDASFRQPFLTSDDNNLIIAEAQFRAGNTSAALATMNGVRSAYGMAAKTGLTGAALLTAILEEKYVANFQNVEAYNDYRRTCYPNITPASQTFGGNVPPRFYYASIELTANPNIPDIGSQPRRNAVDSPALTTAADGTACKGQK